LLSALVPNEVTAQGTTGYQPLAYWSAQQTEVTPACRVDVGSAESISITIKVSRLTKCPFVVRSGGHAAFAGGSSIENGILINMKPLNMVELSEDRSTTSVGPGNTWYDVYTKLDPLKVSVVGGREAGVGVGGLTLGGKPLT
jgi:FAD/FMN-containing dehydrogenase